MEWVDAAMLEGLDDSDDEYYITYLARRGTTEGKPKPAGSVPGKRANKERERELWGERLVKDYFVENSTYDDRTYRIIFASSALQHYSLPVIMLRCTCSYFQCSEDFRRRFRMRRSLFETIMNVLVSDVECDYFVQRQDATGRLGFLPEQKVTCALRLLAYGASADQLDELIRMGESTVLKTLKFFCENVIRLLGPEYLRKPTSDDLETLLGENAARGFPGMIGSLDCMHWCWKNCPTAWQGAFQGKEKTSTVILEAVASKSLWIWHAFCGMPGANNDLNVLERSPLLNDLVNGVAPKAHFTVKGATYDQAYYLTDGIYPSWAIFQSSISAPQGKKRKLYAAAQEVVRKDVERAFGVLQQRFRIVALPCKLWKVDAMNDVMLACIILHNMIVEDEMPFRSLTHDYLFEDNRVCPARTEAATQCPVTTIANALRAIEDEELHYELKNDLIEHVWSRFGEGEFLANRIGENAIAPHFDYLV